MASYQTRYQYSNTAKRLGEISDPRNEKRVITGNRRRGMGISYVLFVGLALAVTAFVLVSYVSLKSDITNRLTHISELETQLNDLRLENDATYSRINSNMDLEQIRDTAIYELGMTYAKEGQTETFTSENGDYVRQLADIPQ